MTYVWLGLGLSLLVALGTLLFQTNLQQRPLEYKTSEPGTSRRRSRSRSRGRDEDPDRCVICLTDIEVSKREYLPCFHFFHPECIRAMVRYNRQCPVCRTPF